MALIRKLILMWSFPAHTGWCGRNINNKIEQAANLWLCWITIVGRYRTQPWCQSATGGKRIELWKSSRVCTTLNSPRWTKGIMIAKWRDINFVIELLKSFNQKCVVLMCQQRWQRDRFPCRRRACYYANRGLAVHTKVGLQECLFSAIRFKCPNSKAWLKHSLWVEISKWKSDVSLHGLGWLHLWIYILLLIIFWRKKVAGGKWGQVLTIYNTILSLSSCE